VKQILCIKLVKYGDKYLFIVPLIVSNSGCVRLDSAMISGLAGLWREYLVISRYLADGTKEIHAKPVRPRWDVGTSQYKSEVSDWGKKTITRNCKQYSLVWVFLPFVHVVKSPICLVCIVDSFKLSCV